MKTFFPKLSNTDLTDFSKTKLSNIVHLFKIGDVSVKLVSVNWTRHCNYDKREKPERTTNDREQT